MNRTVPDALRNHYRDMPVKEIVVHIDMRSAASVAA